MTGNPPTVSVIIPAYNRDKYLEETVESVLNQTYRDIELIVVNDGSTDKSKEILSRYESRIKLLEHENGINKGQSASINLGFKYVQGKYTAILDSDDLWEPDKIECQVEYLEEHKDIGLVYGNGIAINENGDYLYDIYRPGHNENNSPEEVLLDCYFLVPNNSLVRTEVLRLAGGFDEKLRAAQDHDMAIRIAEITNMAYVDKKLFRYRRHADSISSTNTVLRWLNGFNILEKAKNRYPYSKIIIRKRKAVLHFRLFQCYKENNYYTKAIYHLLLSGLNDPLRGLKVLTFKENISSPH